METKKHCAPIDKRILNKGSFTENFIPEQSSQKSQLDKEVPGRYLTSHLSPGTGLQTLIKRELAILPISSKFEALMTLSSAPAISLSPKPQ